MKKLYMFAICSLLAGMATAGTVQQNLGFDESSFIKQADLSGPQARAWNTSTNNCFLIGQSFSVSNETVLRAITLQKAATQAYSGGANDFYLWVGEYTTSNTVGATYVTEVFDLEGITLTNENSITFNLDADVTLPAGNYAFQLMPEEDVGNNFYVTTGYGSVDGVFLRGTSPGTIPVDIVPPDDTRDLTFALHSEVVGALTNVVPNATSQNVTTMPNLPLEITLSGIDPDGVTSLTYAVVDTPTNGVLSGTAPDLIYTPDTDFAGTDLFTFTVNDGVFDSSAATISITVTNIPPTAGSQSVNTSVDSPVDITLSGSDPEGSNLTYNVVDSPASGVLTGTAPNLNYTPNSGFVGDDSFTFTVNDGAQDSELATVSISVIPLGTTLSFNNLSADFLSSSNLLTVGGVKDGLTVSGASVAEGDFLHSVVYENQDYDGDSLADTLSFDVRVACVKNSTYTFSTTPGDAEATLGPDNVTVQDGGLFSVNPSGKAWCGDYARMKPGYSLIFTVENVSMTGTSSSLTGTFIAFKQVVFAESRQSGHQFVLGMGSGLTGYEYDTSLVVSDLSASILYANSTGNEFAGVSSVDLDFSISGTPIDRVDDISIAVVSDGTEVALSWPTERGGSYGVQAKSALLDSTWSNIISNVAGTGFEVTVTNTISTDVEFYRAYLED